MHLQRLQRICHIASGALPSHHHHCQSTAKAEYAATVYASPRDRISEAHCRTQMGAVIDGEVLLLAFGVVAKLVIVAAVGATAARRGRRMLAGAASGCCP